MLFCHSSVLYLLTPHDCKAKKYLFNCFPTGCGPSLHLINQTKFELYPTQMTNPQTSGVVASFMLG